MSIETFELSILKKCDYFTNVQLWPLQSKLDPRNWLTNFTEAEKPFALRLLNSFLYFSEPIVDQLLYSAFHRLSMTISRSDTCSEWLAFLRNCIFVVVTGEIPNATDSGFLLARKSRQVLGIPQDQFLMPDEALRRLIRNANYPVVFLDDFVGSGNQFLCTWNRIHRVDGQQLSFKGLLAASNECYYCPLVCTQFGAERIENGDALRSLSPAPLVKILPAHLIGTRYSVLSIDSYAWANAAERTAGIDVIRAASLRAGIPDSRGDSVNDWRGYRELGLALAFSHSVPDATICLFRWEENGWKPLIRRR